MEEGVEDWTPFLAGSLTGRLQKNCGSETY